MAATVTSSLLRRTYLIETRPRTHTLTAHSFGSTKRIVSCVLSVGPRAMDPRLVMPYLCPLGKNHISDQSCLAIIFFLPSNSILPTHHCLHSYICTDASMRRRLTKKPAGKQSSVARRSILAKLRKILRRHVMSMNNTSTSTTTLDNTYPRTLTSIHVT